METKKGEGADLERPRGAAIPPRINEDEGAVRVCSRHLPGFLESIEDELGLAVRAFAGNSNNPLLETSRPFKAKIERGEYAAPDDGDVEWHAQNAQEGRTGPRVVQNAVVGSVGRVKDHAGALVVADHGGAMHPAAVLTVRAAYYHPRQSTAGGGCRQASCSMWQLNRVILH